MCGVRMRQRFVEFLVLRRYADCGVGCDCLYCYIGGICCELCYFDYWDISSNPQDLETR